MADVMYNIDKLRDSQKAIKKQRTDLLELNTKLKADLDLLKQGWKTPAGKKFFSDNIVDWDDDVKKYANMLEGISQMLEKAIGEYNAIDNDAKQLYI